LTDDLVGRIALEASRTGVPGQDATVQSDHIDGVVDDGIDEQLEGRRAGQGLVSAIGVGHQIPQPLLRVISTSTLSSSKTFQSAC
jgi:hypothetical protein